MSDVDISDPSHFNAVVLFLRYAYRPGNSFAGTVHFVLTDTAAGHTLSKYITVRPTEPSGSYVSATDEAPDGPILCHIKSEKDIMIGMLSGSLDPMVVLMMGQIYVDDLPQLMAFSTAFDLTKEKYLEFQASLVPKETEESANVIAEGNQDAAVLVAESIPSESANPSFHQVSLRHEMEPIDGVIPADQMVVAATDDAGSQSLKRKAALASLGAIEAAKAMSVAMDRGYETIRATEQYKKAEKEFQELLVRTGDSFRSKIEELSKSAQHAKFIASVFIRQKGQDVVTKLEQTAYGPAEDVQEETLKKQDKEAKRLQEKRELEAKLQQLKLENEQKEQARKQRLQKAGEASSNSLALPESASE